VGRTWNFIAMTSQGTYDVSGEVRDSENANFPAAKEIGDARLSSLSREEVDREKKQRKRGLRKNKPAIEASQSASLELQKKKHNGSVFRRKMGGKPHELWRGKAAASQAATLII